MTEFDYDLFTIGAGSGGVAASRRAGALGARVAICESTRVGGTCVLRGCVPKKLLMHATEFGADMEDAAGYGWKIEGARLDWPALITAKNSELDRLEGVYQRMLRDAGVKVVLGHGRVTGPHTVEVDGQPYSARNILVATGGAPYRPEFPGAEFAITSREALDLPALPRRLLIVGGGYIGCEFASIFNGAGVDVTLAVRTRSVLRGFDEEVRTALASEMTQRGVRLRVNASVCSIEKTGGGYNVRFDDGEAEIADLVLYATGRWPRSADLGLEALGIELGPRGQIPVDEWSRTSVDSIYAVGDVTDRYAVTPVAIMEGRAVAENLFDGQSRSVHHNNVAHAVFSQPPVAAVGLTEAAAEALGQPLRVYCARFRPLKHALSGRRTHAVMKLVVDDASDRVLGCHMVGDDAPEIIQGMAVAVVCGATKAQFDATVAVHPTAAEEFVLMRSPEVR